jgi:hypothetical protein
MPPTSLEHALATQLSHFAQNPLRLTRTSAYLSLLPSGKEVSVHLDHLSIVGRFYWMLYQNGGIDFPKDARRFIQHLEIGLEHPIRSGSACALIRGSRRTATLLPMRPLVEMLTSGAKQRAAAIRLAARDILSPTRDAFASTLGHPNYAVGKPLHRRKPNRV